MRINQQNKTMDIEARDINYILPAYIRTYLFYTKNEMPERIIFPMFPSVKFGDVDVPIEYLPPSDPIVVEIIHDSSSVAEVTPSQEAEIDAKDSEIKMLRAELEDIKRSIPLSDVEKLPTESKAKAAFNVDTNPKHQPPHSRKPKLPSSGDIGAGVPLSDMQPRDKRDIARAKADLVEGPDVDESMEKPYEKDIDRDEQGRPVVKD